MNNEHMDNGMPQQTELESLLDQRDYINSIIESGEPMDAMQDAFMHTELANIEREIKEAIQWS